MSKHNKILLSIDATFNSKKEKKEKKRKKNNNNKTDETAWRLVSKVRHNS